MKGYHIDQVAAMFGTNTIVARRILRYHKVRREISTYCARQVDALAQLSPALRMPPTARTCPLTDDAVQVPSSQSRLEF